MLSDGENRKAMWWLCGLIVNLYGKMRIGCFWPIRIVDSVYADVDGGLLWLNSRSRFNRFW